MLDSFLRHVTKDSYGPVPYLLPNGTRSDAQAVVQKFHDAFSVLEWGKMPDVLSGHGNANALVYHHLNTLVKSETAWRDFLRSSDALTFRKAGSSIPQGGNVSTMLNELTSQFPIATNYLGLLNEKEFKELDSNTTLKPHEFGQPDFKQPEFNFKNLFFPVSEWIHEEKIPSASVMGRTVWDYSVWKKQTTPKVLPFEFHCHFTLTEKTVESLNTDCLALPKTASLATLHAGSTWDFPLIELVLSQDPFQKRIGFSEALWITGFSPDVLQRSMITAAWISTFVRSHLHHLKANAHLKMNSIVLRFSVNDKQEFILTDSLSLDQIHLSRESEQVDENLHLDSAIDFYKKTSWYESVVHAKKQARQQGLSEWKRLCVEPAPWLDPKVKESLENKSRVVLMSILGNSRCS